jgi:hypothetical protein
MARLQKGAQRVGTGKAGVIVAEPPARLAGLRRAHKQLLDRIARKKKDIARMVAEQQKIHSAMVTDVAPLVEACRTLDGEIHALFDELLAPGRLSRRAHKQVARLHAVLQREGALTPRWAGTDDEDDEHDEDDIPDEDVDPRPGGITAQRPDAAKGPIAAIRAVYRRLAHALHPDKVPEGDERDRRTEIMKDVTRAYGDGDLARLLELERSWAALDERAETPDEIALRCAAMERTNAELRVQVRGLDRELAALRRSPHGDLVRDRRAGGSPVDDLTEDARTHRADLETIRDHVIAFRDGKLTLADFLRGPGSADEDENLLAVAAALAELARGFDRPRRRRR